MRHDQLSIATALLDFVSVSNPPEGGQQVAGDRFGEIALTPLGVEDGTDITDLLMGATILVESAISLTASARSIDRDEVIFELRDILSRVHT